MNGLAWRAYGATIAKAVSVPSSHWLSKLKFDFVGRLTYSDHAASRLLAHLLLRFGRELERRTHLGTYELQEYSVAIKSPWQLSQEDPVRRGRIVLAARV